MNGPFNPADLDYFPPGEPWPNGPDARAQNRFELIPFDRIAFDTTPAYLVKGLIPRVGLCVFWGPPKCGKSFLCVRSPYARRARLEIPRSPRTARRRRLLRIRGAGRP
jgi:hypothetical protein